MFSSKGGTLRGRLFLFTELLQKEPCTAKHAKSANTNTGTARGF
jgi:hypothetical protein